jgi:hypothetical protein
MVSGEKMQQVITVPSITKLVRPVISGSLTILTIVLFNVAPKRVEASSLTVVANSLNNPRGIAFDRNQALYVAEAGRGGSGPIIDGPELGVGLVFGQTGAITRVQNGIQERIITGLPSLTLNPQGAPLPSVNGSDGPAIGPHDIIFDEAGNLLIAIGFASNPSVRGNLGLPGADMGQVVKYSSDISGNWQKQGGFSTDLATYEQTNNPDQRSFISNPYDLKRLDNNKTLVVDAGANALFEFDAIGNLSLVTTFDTRLVDGIVMEAVPTSVALGPDGAYYVSELTGVPFPEGGARVYRIVPGQAPEIYADGFTQITGLEFDQSGNLYVLEYAVNSLLSPNNQLIGRLTQVAPNGQRTAVIDADGTLIAPNNITLGPDGDLYIANRSTFAGQGEIIRLDIASVPESASPISILIFGGLGLGWMIRRNRN